MQVASYGLGPCGCGTAYFALDTSKVSTGRKMGKRVEKLRKQGGWSETSAVFWKYVDDGEKWEDAATEGIGL